MKKPKQKRRYIVTVKIVSDDGTAPDVQTLCGDVVFVSLREGQRATWKLTAERR
jgi:hypothetical protein